MLNLGDVRVPDATVTVDGRAATAGLELDSETTTPPVGAGAFKVTLACTVLPPATLDCPSVTTEGARGLTVSVTGTAMPL